MDRRPFTDRLRSLKIGLDLLLAEASGLNDRQLFERVSELRNELDDAARVLSESAPKR